MRLYLYVFDSDAEPSLLEEFTEREEAVMACQELVAVDGYPRAEVWNGRGDRLYGVAREGGSLRSFRSPADLDESEDEDEVIGERRPVIRIVSDDVVATARGAAADEVADRDPGQRAGMAQAERTDGRRPDQADEPPQPDACLPQQLLGERPGRPEQWFGI